MQNTYRVALVIGITGSIGKEVAAALMGRGWQVRALHRNPTAAAASVSLPKAVQWIAGDAMQLNDVVQAARGTSLIVHAANPPNYRNWRGLALPMLDNAIAAAKFCNARILLPATIYNFGAGIPVLRENSPQIPNSRKGQVRVEMELRLQRASLYGVRSIVVRCGDFFGPGAGNSWLTRGMMNSRSLVFDPGAAGVGHSWAYLPDLAETMVRLVESERPMSDYEVFHFRGHWFEQGSKILELACRVAGNRCAAHQSFPVVGNHSRRAVHRGMPRDARNALSLAGADTTGQCEALCADRSGAAYADRRGTGGHSRRRPRSRCRIEDPGMNTLGRRKFLLAGASLAALGGAADETAQRRMNRA